MSLITPFPRCSSSFETLPPDTLSAHLNSEDRDSRHLFSLPLDLGSPVTGKINLRSVEVEAPHNLTPFYLSSLNSHHSTCTSCCLCPSSFPRTALCFPALYLCSSPPHHSHSSVRILSTSRNQCKCHPAELSQDHPRWPPPMRVLICDFTHSTSLAEHHTHPCVPHTAGLGSSS